MLPKIPLPQVRGKQPAWKWFGQFNAEWWHGTGHRMCSWAEPPCPGVSPFFISLRKSLDVHPRGRTHGLKRYAILESEDWPFDAGDSEDRRGIPGVQQIE